MSKKRWVNNLLLWLLFTVLGAFVMAIVADFQGLHSESPIPYYFRCLFTGANAPAYWLVGCGAAIIITALLDTQTHTLDIALKPAGNGQFGTARLATEKERRELYQWVNAKDATKPGFTLEYTKNRFEVDTSDRFVMQTVPPGGGKTSCMMVPTLIYNALVNTNTNGKGASILSLDCKGQEYETTHKTMEACGYRVVLLDYRNPSCSMQNNMMHPVNVNMEKACSVEDPGKALEYRATAERHAKILAESIIATSGMDQSANNAYFTETASGLITAMVLIVAEFAAPEEKHIVSVFRLIIEMNGLMENDDRKKNDLIQKNRLEELLKLLPGDVRARLYAGPATGADVRTSMNVFSSAMSKLLSFMDARLEQMICSQSEGLTAEEFMEKPTCIYLVLPDEDTTAHFFASLFVQQMSETLIGIASSLPDQRLSRPALILWDEFGQSPPCRNATSWFTAWRSRGIRLMIALQSPAQLEDKYGKTKAEIIQDAVQVRMYSHLSSGKVAQELSREMGNYTISTGSATSSSRRNSDSSSRSLTGRALKTPDEIAAMPIGDWLILANDYHPILARLRPYSKFWKLPIAKFEGSPRPVISIPYLTEAKLRERYVDKLPTEPYPGMFDDPREDLPPLNEPPEQMSPPEEPTQRGFRRKKERSVTPDAQEQADQCPSS